MFICAQLAVIALGWIQTKLWRSHAEAPGFQPVTKAQAKPA
jgi:hypothetical protein